ncbi:M99 family carboxypeptidase catalytic domain-containing protein [Thermovibrio ammonificans]|uniref:Tat pathway signal sequence domain protein n=1 Tax=Thermovibrio ammonificans (strain DSM 15698 / JCM 12110 / HB-1) TaxID=648996 RepID=E8T4Z1_THEA1|nr:M99 family carboxypeptidase catalytic domain-containing protein [Thermovibrio ammonificans]ADU97523.1 Tat pathway signal sequence domain protein [Thermovibrio ammonificans HB-1]
MENPGRRELVKGLIFSVPLLAALKSEALASPGRGALIELPPFPFQETHLQGERKGGRILVVGGIHGNEPGAYTAAEILRTVKVKRGELFIAPRSNFVSILADKRGYNGDMNRKFGPLSKKDPDYKRVQDLKEFIGNVKPDILLTLHDGYGFHSVNPRAWGQCIVIDAEEHNGFPLGKEARAVSKAVNRSIHKREWRIPVYNTRTFAADTKHPEQRRSLTYYCLTKPKVPAICLEVSKQLPNLETKVKFHLMMLKEFFKLHGVEIEPSFDYLIANVERLVNPKRTYTVDLLINGRHVSVSSSRTFKVPKGSRVKFLSFHGSDGTNAVSFDVNLNLRRVAIRRRIAFTVKDDFRKVFSVRFEVV